MVFVVENNTIPEIGCKQKLLISIGSYHRKPGPRGSYCFRNFRFQSADEIRVRTLFGRRGGGGYVKKSN